MLKYLLLLIVFNTAISDDNCQDTALPDSSAILPVLSETKGILGYMSQHGFEIKSEKEKKYWKLKKILSLLNKEGIREAYVIYLIRHREIAEHLEKKLGLKDESLGNIVTIDDLTDIIFETKNLKSYDILEAFIKEQERQFPQKISEYKTVIKYAKEINLIKKEIAKLNLELIEDFKKDKEKSEFYKVQKLHNKIDFELFDESMLNYDLKYTHHRKAFKNCLQTSNCNTELMANTAPAELLEAMKMVKKRHEKEENFNLLQWRTYILLLSREKGTISGVKVPKGSYTYEDYFEAEALGAKRGLLDSKINMAHRIFYNKKATDEDYNESMLLMIRSIKRIKIESRAASLKGRIDRRRETLRKLKSRATIYNDLEKHNFFLEE